MGLPTRRSRTAREVARVTDRWPAEARRQMLQRDTLDALMASPSEATLADFIEARQAYAGMAEAMAIPPEDYAAIYAEVYGAGRQEAS